MSKLIENCKNGFDKVGGFCHFLNGKKGFGSLISGLISVLLGFLVGFIVMLALDADSALPGLGTLFSYSLTHNPARMIYQATPMMLTGLAIAFSFKLGLFNIGITGQVTAGAFTSICLGIIGNNFFGNFIFPGGLFRQGLLDGFFFAPVRFRRSNAGGTGA